MIKKFTVIMRIFIHHTNALCMCCIIFVFRVHCSRILCDIAASLLFRKYKTSCTPLFKQDIAGYLAFSHGTAFVALKLHRHLPDKISIRRGFESAREKVKCCQLDLPWVRHWRGRVRHNPANSFRIHSQFTVGARTYTAQRRTRNLE